VRWIGELSIFALLTALAFYAAAPFRHTLLDVVLVLAPLLIVFVVLPAAKTLFRESAYVARSFTWWQGLWLVMFLSGLVFRGRDEYDIRQSAIDGWALYRIALDAIVGWILITRLLNGKRPWNRPLCRGLIGIMAVYPLICLFSTTWSAAPGFTLFRSAEYLLDLSVVAALVATLDSVEEFQKWANWTWILLGLLVLSAWIGAIVDPGDAFLEGYSYGPLRVRLEGVCPSLDANSIGEYCAILAGIALCRLLDDPDQKYDRVWYRLLFVAALVTLIFTQTRADVAAFLISLVLVFIFTRRLLLGAVLMVTTSLAGLITVLFTNFGYTVASYLLRGQSLTEAESLTGRLDFWQFAMQKISERPWMGYGGYAGGRFVVLPGLGIPGNTEVLNTMVESFLDVGIWGPAVLVTVLVSIWSYLIRSSRHPALKPSERHLAVEILLAVSVVSVRSFVTGNITSHVALAFLTILGCAEFLRRRMKLEQSPAERLSPAWAHCPR
jgi:O-antigen ligase